MKVIGKKSNGLVLGVHMIGAHSSDLIAEAALAIEMGAVSKISPSPFMLIRPWLNP
ncbi:MAG: hypothetical protein R2877_04240 [Bdellovibrionota bacterium]